MTDNLNPTENDRQPATRSPCSNAWMRADGTTVECGFEHPAGQWCPAELEHARAGAQAEAERVATALATIWIEPDSRYLPSPDEFDTDTFDPDVAATWPNGMWVFLKSNCPNREDAIEAFRAWREEHERDLRIAVLRAQAATKEAEPARGDTPDPIAAAVKEKLSRGIPVLGDAPEAAYVLDITEDALWKRKQRGDLPPKSVVEQGGSVQFRLDLLQADSPKKRKRVR